MPKPLQPANGIKFEPQEVVVRSSFVPGGTDDDVEKMAERGRRLTEKYPGSRMCFGCADVTEAGDSSKITATLRCAAWIARTPQAILIAVLGFTAGVRRQAAGLGPDMVRGIKRILPLGAYMIGRGNPMSEVLDTALTSLAFASMQLSGRFGDLGLFDDVPVPSAGNRAQRRRSARERRRDLKL